MFAGFFEIKDGHIFLSSMCASVWVEIIFLNTSQNIDLFTAPTHACKFSTVRNFSNDSYTPLTFFTTHRPTVFPIFAIHAMGPPKLSKKDV